MTQHSVGPAVPGGIRVLVVDDDEAVAAVHRGYTDSVPGFRVVGVVHRGGDVLPAVRDLRPDLVLLDVHLPDVSGTEVLRRLRAEGLDVDVMAVTAAREVDTVREAMAGGVVHYLVKPFALAAFRDRLQGYAEHRARLRGAASVADQADVDRLLRGRQGGVLADDLPKGLSTRTLAVVVQALRDQAPADLSAAEVAGRCGIARVSARRYLEHLEHQGRAVVRPRYGGAGRPENGYRWTGGG
ncbi:response regulator [Aquipuribacter hungaricus]|uniref:Transcriptional regulatory protein n=1 Tax=Aquipuribacter hungaricus TaxID=545624 RepID=A0ABV7WDK4_9MICO